MFRRVAKPVAVSAVNFAQVANIGTTTPFFGFIGLGAMGRHMATNIARNGYNVILYDADDETLKLCQVDCINQKVKAIRAPNAAAVAAQCDVLVTMLPNGQICEDVYLGVNGVLQGSKGRVNATKPLLCIDSSTIDTETSLKLYNSLKEGDVTYMDAPVSGGIVGAQRGSLTFMCGAEKEAFERAKLILGLMGGKIVHCGANSTGLVAKIVNNLILGISNVAVAEGMNLGVKLGADPNMLAQIINSSTGKCWSSEVNNPCDLAMPDQPRPALNEYQGGFQVDLMIKDLGLALDSKTDTPVKLPLGNHVRDLYKMVSTEGHGRKDFSYIYKYFE